MGIMPSACCMLTPRLGPASGGVADLEGCLFSFFFPFPDEAPLMSRSYLTSTIQEVHFKSWGLFIDSPERG